MRILILGAGATGGYYGGKLAAAGADVTFLVRPKRAESLAAHGLIVKSPKGDVATPVKTVTKENVAPDYDVVILSSKAYDLDGAIEAIRPAVSQKTFVLPLLNGLRHLDVLDSAFGRERVLGGLCHISVTLSPEGEVRHLNNFDILTHGARFPSQKDFSDRLDRELKRGGFSLIHSGDIMGAIWEKWSLIATLAGSTCLMRANIGEIVAVDGGREIITGMLDEACRTAAANGHPPRRAATVVTRGVLTDPASKMSASMRRDLEAGGRTEADHIIGDMVARAKAKGVSVPLLSLANAHLKAHENRLESGTKLAAAPISGSAQPLAMLFTVLRGLR